ncbi:MAG: RICIN domain-containing protein [Lachnospiraceae bacterium]|nr:RICIN domain-containing protein [Lachnospiraceae bacterium]
MLKKVLSFVLIFTLVFSTSVVFRGENTVFAASSKVWNGKTDTKWYTGDLDYYEISTPEQLAGLAELVNNGTSFYGVLICLTKDIALNKTTNFNKWDKKKPAHQWTMIGSKEHPFCGTFNGQGHTISGLYINDTEKYSNWFNVWYADAGLFGYVKGSNIVNVKIKKAYLNVLGTIGTVSAYSQNSNFYGIDIDNVKLLSGNAGGIVGNATYDYTETWMNIFTVAAMEAVLACGGVIINPLLFGDALKLPNDFQGNIFFSCKVKNLKCLDTKTTGGLVASGGQSDSGIGCLNCLVMNYSVKSDGTKGLIMGVQTNENYAIIKNCYCTNSSIDKKSSNRQFIDTKSVKKIKKKALCRSGASKLGKAFKKVKGKEPQLKLFTQTKVNVDESQYRILEDGYYTIRYGSYVTVNGDSDIVASDTAQKFYFRYRDGGFYTITNEEGYILTGNSSNDDVYAQKVDYNEHRFTQRWVVEKKGDAYYIWLKDTEKALSQYTGFMFLPGTGISLEEGWFEDEDIGHNVIWYIEPAQ